MSKDFVSEVAELGNFLSGKNNREDDELDFDALRPREVFNSGVIEGQSRSRIRTLTSKPLSEIDPKFAGKTISRKQAFGEDSEEESCSDDENMSDGDVSGGWNVANSDDDDCDSEQGENWQTKESDEDISGSGVDSELSEEEPPSKVEATKFSLLKRKSESDIMEGKSVMALQSMYYRLLEVRIHLQPLLHALNSKSTNNDYSDKLETFLSDLLELDLLIPSKKMKGNSSDDIDRTLNACHKELFGELLTDCLKDISSSNSAKSGSGFACMSGGLDKQVKQSLKASIDDLLVKTQPENSDGFNDFKFYHGLLKEIVKMGSDDPASACFVNDQIRKSDKKQVDTKASKARQLRFTPHQKLINFMAPNDITTWTDSQRKELCKNLLSQ